MEQELEDEIEQVMETLMDVLTRDKMDQITKREVVEELERSLLLQKQEINHTFQYHPIFSVDSTVRFFVNKFYKRKHDVEEESSLTPDEGVEEDEEDDDIFYDNVLENSLVLPPSADFLRSLCVVYPDIDPEFLNQTCQRFANRPEEIQSFLEENSHTIPARRTVQCVQFNMLKSQYNPHTEKMWQCPECRAWQILQLNRAEEKVQCNEIVSCGQFCIKCNKKSHEPFSCRKMSVRAIQEENEVDIFKRLTASADEIRGTVKIFKMTPKNDLNFSDPLDILYSLAEATFFRMLGKSARNFGNIVQVPNMRHGNGMLDMSSIAKRNSIDCIRYVENEILRERFMNCKKEFQAKGIPADDRLVFHGTNASLDSINEEGFLLSKCKRFAHGYGIYFSEFPDVSKVYGGNLLLVRVMLGRPYQGKEHKIPEGFDSKIYNSDVDGNSHMVIIEKEEQILPAFHIQVKW